MLEIDRIPKFIYDFVVSKGVDINDLYISAYCDMDEEYVFCDTYIFATSSSLYVTSGNFALEDECEKHGNAENVWEERGFREYRISDIKKLHVEELISGASFTAQLESGAYELITYLSNNCRTSVLTFLT